MSSSAIGDFLRGVDIDDILDDSCENGGGEREAGMELPSPESIDLISQNRLNSENWTIPLRDLTGELDFTEWNYSYKYKSVYDPNDLHSGKFLVFCKHVDSENWNILNGLLSRKYVIGRLAKFSDIFETLIAEQNIEITNIHRTEEPFKNGILFKTNLRVDYFGHDMLGDNAKLIFRILTGINFNTIDVGANLSFLLTNAYNGGYSLRVDNTISMTGTTDDNEVVTFVDYFSLSKKAKVVAHLPNINENFQPSELFDVRGEIDDFIEKTTDNELSDDEFADIVDNLASPMKTPSRNLFVSLCQALGGGTRKKFYIIMIANYVIHYNFEMNTYIPLRKKIEKLIS